MLGGGGLFFILVRQCIIFQASIRATDPTLASKGMAELIFFAIFYSFLFNKSPIIAIT